MGLEKERAKLMQVKACISAGKNSPVDYFCDASASGPTIGTAAKEIAKSIKEGLKEDNVIYCKHCGEKIDADSTFCKCGKQL